MIGSGKRGAKYGDNRGIKRCSKLRNSCYDKQLDKQFHKQLDK